MGCENCDSPGAFVKKIGGGGRLVPLIGETQQLSSISVCSTERYDEITQNSSKFMLGVSKLVVSAVVSSADSVDEVLEGDDSCLLLSTSRTKLKMRFRLSMVMRSLR